MNATTANDASKLRPKSSVRNPRPMTQAGAQRRSTPVRRCADSGSWKTGTACNGVDDDADLTIDDGCPASIATGSIQYAVSTAPAGSPIPMDPTATVLRTVVAYRDSTSFDHDVPYTITVINGDADLLLEPGELFIVTVDVTDIVDTISALPVVITANKRWTLEIQTPVGATIDLTRSMPGELNAVMQLH